MIKGRQPPSSEHELLAPHTTIAVSLVSRNIEPDRTKSARTFTSWCSSELNMKNVAMKTPSCMVRVLLFRLQKRSWRALSGMVLARNQLSLDPSGPFRIRRCCD